MKGLVRILYGGLCLMILAVSFSAPFPVQAEPVIPTTWDIVYDDFESGSLDQWGQDGQVALVPGAGINGSTGLSVTANQDQNSIYQTDVAKAAEGYLTFWFNPNQVDLPEPDPNYWPPGTSLSIAEVLNSEDWWPPLVALYLRKPPGEDYQGFLAWPTDEAGTRHYDYENAFELGDGWQQITVGYRIDEWVAVWVDGILVRYDESTVVHPDPYGDIVYFGKIRTNSSSTPSGTILFDQVSFQVPRVEDLWVDADQGDDDNDGLTPTTAFETIQKAADMAGPGTTVHILPGVYRETVWPALDGTAAEPVIYQAENGPGTVSLRGSEPSASLSWTQLTSNSIGLPAGVDPTDLYYADLSTWQLEEAPRFVMDISSGYDRLPLAREPDWDVSTEWKTHEFWWAADGGSAPAACDPTTDSDPNCDLPQRSLDQLTDQTSDSAPAGIEPGNLTTLGDLTGATLVAIDTLQGHYAYRRTITAHNIAAGRITVDRICEHDGGSGNPGLGWGSKYYLENKPNLLDSPGEWWYDPASNYLYLWPPTPGDPGSQNIEISRRDYGFQLRNRSYITLDGLTVELVNHSAVYQSNWETHHSYDNTLRNLLLQYANYGLYILQSVSADQPTTNVINGFTLENSEIAYIDSQGIRLIDWWENGAAADSFSHSGIRNTLIKGNEFHHLGFRTDGDNAIGLSFGFANQLRFEDNHVHHVAHNGVQFSKSVIQSEKEYDFDPSEIKTGEILIRGNIFEKACQLTTDCGGLKLWGSPPDNHVYRDVLVTGNIFRNTYGWTWVSEQRGRWMGGESSEVRGMGGFGLYVDHASGIHAYRNISYNNAYTNYMIYGVWRDGPMVYVNNLAANSLHGMSWGGGQYDTHGSVDTRVLDNILINNEAFGIALSYAEGRYANISVDHNLYFNNGWRSYDQGGTWHAGPMLVRECVGENCSWDPYETLAEAQAATPWEDHGLDGDPAFWDYDVQDHDLFDASWPDFHLTAGSAAIDQGLSSLPASLVTLLTDFNIPDYHLGTAYDIGRYEAGYRLLASPTSHTIDPGGTAVYALSLIPSDLPHEVSLSVISPSPALSTTLSNTTLMPSGVVTLTVTHTGTLETQVYSIPVSSSGSGFSQDIAVQLLVGGERIYLPALWR